MNTHGQPCLNPFEIRATALAARRMYNDIVAYVLIPLKSGQLLWRTALTTLTSKRGLNPFEIRATALARRTERAAAREAS